MWLLGFLQFSFTCLKLKLIFRYGRPINSLNCTCKTNDNSATVKVYTINNIKSCLKEFFIVFAKVISEYIKGKKETKCKTIPSFNARFLIFNYSDVFF